MSLCYFRDFGAPLDAFTDLGRDPHGLTLALQEVLPGGVKMVSLPS